MSKVKELELRMQLSKIEASKYEMMHKIELRKEDIARLEAGIVIQDEAYNKTLSELNDLKD